MNNRPRQWFRTGAALSLLLIAAALLVLFALSAAPTAQQAGQAEPPPAQEPPAVAIDSPLPTPPTPIVIIEPTWTPWPTLTPRPTQFRNPDEVTQPFPTKAPSSDASGVILYSTINNSEQTIEIFAMDREGRPIDESEPLPVDLDFSPLLGSPSPNGRFLIIGKPVFPVAIPYIFDWESQQIRPVFKDNGIAGIEYGWHPDNQHFLFWSFGTEELWLVDILTGKRIVLTFTHGPPQGASLSPDGQTIIYGDRSEVAFEALWSVGALGGDAKILRDLQISTYVFGWSPDGQNVIYMGKASSSNSDGGNDVLSSTPLSLFRPTEQAEQDLSLPFLGGWRFRPVWSPDGQWVAVTGSESSNSYGCGNKNTDLDWVVCRFVGASIYIQNVKTGDLRRLADGIEPTWSPDGSMLAFLSNQSGSSEIWTINKDGSNLRQVTHASQIIQKIIWTVRKD